MDQTKSIELQKKRLECAEERARARASRGVCIHWTGLLDWTTGLTLELTFELFFLLLMINIAVVLLAKVNLGVLGK